MINLSLSFIFYTIILYNLDIGRVVVLVCHFYRPINHLDFFGVSKFDTLVEYFFSPIFFKVEIR